MEKQGFVYIWFDSKRKMYYIGSHWGFENDGYICSSHRMRQAYNRRPETFRRRILTRGLPTRKETLLKEQEWLSLIDNSELLKKYYNMYNWVYVDNWFADDGKRKTVSEKISSTLKVHYSDDEARQRQSDGTKKKFEDDEFREKHRAAILKSFEDGKRTEAQSEISKSLWGTSEYRQKHEDRLIRLKDRFVGGKNINAKQCTDGVDVFDTLKEMAEKHGIHPDNMSKRIKSDKEKWKDFKWIR